MKKLEVILEKNDGLYWSRIVDKGLWMANNAAETKKEAVEGLRAVIEDYQAHEGKTDVFWMKVDAREVEFEIHADVQALFEEHSYLNISAVAERAGLNPSLLRQYSRGIKHPSETQAKKIETTLRALGKELSKIEVYA